MHIIIYFKFFIIIIIKPVSFASLNFWKR